MPYPYLTALHALPISYTALKSSTHHATHPTWHKSGSTDVLYPVPCALQMFMPTILSQGDPDQQAKWLPACMNLQIIGTYAQTELGHGTFVRGLETTATYDAQQQVRRAVV